MSRFQYISVSDLEFRDLTTSSLFNATEIRLENVWFENITLGKLFSSAFWCHFSRSYVKFLSSSTFLLSFFLSRLVTSFFLIPPDPSGLEGCNFKELYAGFNRTICGIAVATNLVTVRNMTVMKSAVQSAIFCLNRTDIEYFSFFNSTSKRTTAGVLLIFFPCPDPPAFPPIQLHSLLSSLLQSTVGRTKIS
jgi:hypothetical protein